MSATRKIRMTDLFLVMDNWDAVQIRVPSAHLHLRRNLLSSVLQEKSVDDSYVEYRLKNNSIQNSVDNLPRYMKMLVLHMLYPDEVELSRSEIMFALQCGYNPRAHKTPTAATEAESGTDAVVVDAEVLDSVQKICC